MKNGAESQKQVELEYEGWQMSDNAQARRNPISANDDASSREEDRRDRRLIILLVVLVILLALSHIMGLFHVIR
jgi:hypothetical protein